MNSDVGRVKRARKTKVGYERGRGSSALCLYPISIIGGLYKELASVSWPIYCEIL